MRRKITFFLPPLLFLNLTGWYLKNLCPTIFGGDCPELLTAGYNLGVAHPTGYPLFTLLVKISQLIPLSSPAWRANFLNCLIGALTVVTAYFIVKSFNIDNLPAVITAMFLGFGFTFFNEALISRVYLTNLFFSALVVFLLSFETKEYLLLATFLTGLGLTNHLFVILLLPLLFLGFYQLELKEIKYYLVCAAVLGLGVMVYSYLPLRAVTHPFPNWETPYNLTYFLNVVTQKSYRFKMVSRDLSHVVTLLGNVVRSYFQEFYFVGALVSLYGLWRRWGGARYGSLLGSSLILIVLGNLLMVILYGSKGEFYSLYFLPTYLVGVIYLGWGLSDLYGIVVKKGTAVTLTSGIVFFILGFAFVCNLASKLSQRNNYLFYDYAANLMNNQKRESRFIIRSDFSFPIWYSQKVEKRREDVFVLNYPVNDWYLREIIKTHPEILPIARKSATARHFLANFIEQHHEAYQIYTAFVPHEKIPPRFGIWRTLVLDRLKAVNATAPSKGDRPYTLRGDFRHWRLRITPSKSTMQRSEWKLRRAYAGFYTALADYYRSEVKTVEASYFEERSGDML